MSLKSLFFTVFVLSVLLQDVFAQGSHYRTGDVIRVESPDTLSRQLFAAGDWVEMAGVAENDVYLAGRQVRLEGRVGDDAFLAGNEVTVLGYVADMLVATGSVVHIDSEVGGDLIVAGGDVTVGGGNRGGWEYHAGWR